MTHVMEGETTRGRNDSGRTRKCVKRPVTLELVPLERRLSLGSVFNTLLTNSVVIDFKLYRLFC